MTSFTSYERSMNASAESVNAKKKGFPAAEGVVRSAVLHVKAVHDIWVV